MLPRLKIKGTHFTENRSETKRLKTSACILNYLSAVTVLSLVILLNTAGAKTNSWP